MKLIQALILGCGVALATSGYASSVTVTIKSITTDPPITLGTITLTESKKGTLITPNLHDLPPGPHGFHVHVNPSCDDHGNAAGAHFDPTSSGQHSGPFQPGHLGDLPVLLVDKEGNATTATSAPRLKLKDLFGHSLMIHSGGDNYSDTPKKLGGGGARIACGVIANHVDQKKSK